MEQEIWQQNISVQTIELKEQHPVAQQSRRICLTNTEIQNAKSLNCFNMVRFPQTQAIKSKANTGA